MALKLKTKLNVKTDVQVALEELHAAIRRRDEAASAFSAGMDEARNQCPNLIRVEGDLDTTQAEVLRLTENVKMASRANKAGGSFNGITVNFQDPTSFAWDYQMVAKVPGLLQVPGVVTSIKLDKDAVAAAIAAGVVDEDLTNAAKVEVKRNKNGRVVLKIPS